MDFIGKKYQLASQENFEQYLDACGITGDSKIGYLNWKPVFELTKEADRFTILLNTPEKSFTIAFTPGVEFEEEIAPGRKVKTTYTVEGDKIVQTQDNGEGTVATTTRTFGPAELVVTHTLTGWEGKATRLYKAL